MNLNYWAWLLWSISFFRHPYRLGFFPGDVGRCPLEILISDRKYLWYITFYRIYALNTKIFNQIYLLQLVIRDIYSFKWSSIVKVMPKCINFPQEICQAMRVPRKSRGKKHPAPIYHIQMWVICHCWHFE